jgi:pentatricopeptide repeat protein
VQGHPQSASTCEGPGSCCCSEFLAVALIWVSVRPSQPHVWCTVLALAALVHPVEHPFHYRRPLKPHGFPPVAAVQEGKWREAMHVVECMTALSLKPNVITYTTLIKACTSAGASDQAIRAFHMMEADGVKADLIVYNSVMAAFSQRGEWERAWSVHMAMRRAGVSPDIFSYNTLLKACQRCTSICFACQDRESMQPVPSERLCIYVVWKARWKARQLSRAGPPRSSHLHHVIPPSQINPRSRTLTLHQLFLRPCGKQRCATLAHLAPNLQV